MYEAEKLVTIDEKGTAIANGTGIPVRDVLSVFIDVETIADAADKLSVVYGTAVSKDHIIAALHFAAARV